MTTFRVGQGFDVHALVPGRRLVLGGVEIPFERGLLGHSDADVLLHAITDAILGAAAMGDIGAMFPDTDAKHRGADSRDLLRAAVKRIREAGWRIENIDATVVAERPKIAPHVEAMRAVIADCTGVDPHTIGVKGKTMEKLGALGRGEGIAAQAVALLVRS
ncbi:MAG TPA: 2-C-methyl-D-erythritol 2,4-cyclodiphosphate synthase [Burkholderiaceae bacterium]|nr:2-C-methyl-D-erythritol 2,4-cyclodiphosphate synthase [Burkholderiaceae bacterium]HQR70843.1 2-C-methyl-D-erythritol 2,4-cyclodiphosphate synthase [Burkholderiaceae bacterium]